MAKRVDPGPSPPYVPPQRCLGPCGQCGAMVIGRRFVDGQYQDQVPRLSPIFGVSHVCPIPAEQTQEGARA